MQIAREKEEEEKNPTSIIIPHPFLTTPNHSHKQEVGRKTPPKSHYPTAETLYVTVCSCLRVTPQIPIHTHAHTGCTIFVLAGFPKRCKLRAFQRSIETALTRVIVCLSVCVSLLVCNRLTSTCTSELILLFQFTITITDLRLPPFYHNARTTGHMNHPQPSEKV